MKHLFTFLAAILLVSSSYAQTEFWGMTSQGGTTSGGTIFKTDNSGNNQSVVHNFLLENEGANPFYTKLCQASNGKLYGMTSRGGAQGGVIFEYDTITNTYTKYIDFDDYNNGSIHMC